MDIQPDSETLCSVGSKNGGLGPGTHNTNLVA